MDLFRGKGGGGLGEDVENRPAARGRLQAGFPQEAGSLGVGVTHKEVN